MPHRIAQRYFDAITVIEAQGTLVKMNVADYPKMKGESRKKYHRDMKKMAYPEGFRKEISFEELARKLNG